MKLTININLISFNDEERYIRSKSDKIEIMINDEADEVISYKKTF